MYFFILFLWLRLYGSPIANCGEFLSSCRNRVLVFLNVRLATWRLLRRWIDGTRHCGTILRKKRLFFEVDLRLAVPTPRGKISLGTVNSYLSASISFYFAAQWAIDRIWLHLTANWWFNFKQMKHVLVKETRSQRSSNEKRKNSWDFFFF